MQHLGVVVIVCMFLLALLGILHLKKKHPYIYVLGEPDGFFLAGLALLTHVAGLEECIIYSTATLCFAQAWQSLKEYLSAIEQDIRQQQQNKQPANISTAKLFLSRFTPLGVAIFAIFTFTACGALYSLITNKPI